MTETKGPRARPLPAALEPFSTRRKGPVPGEASPKKGVPERWHVNTGSGLKQNSLNKKSCTHPAPPMAKKLKARFAPEAKRCSQRKTPGA